MISYWVGQDKPELLEYFRSFIGEIINVVIRQSLPTWPTLMILIFLRSDSFFNIFFPNRGSAFEMQNPLPEQPFGHILFLFLNKRCKAGIFTRLGTSD